MSLQELPPRNNRIIQHNLHLATEMICPMPHREGFLSISRSIDRQLDLNVDDSQS